MMSKFDDTDRFPAIAAVLWTAAHWDSEALADEARAELELVEREAKAEALDSMADGMCAALELGIVVPRNIDAATEKFIRGHIEILRRGAETFRNPGNFINPQPATDAEQAEAEKAEE